MISVEALLAPILDAEPSGPDLRYDAEFMALEQAARGKPGEQYGQTIIEPQAPEWPVVLEGAERLLMRTRDLRVALTWTRAATHTMGFKGFAQGVALIDGLLERQWPTVHPQLDASDHDDATMRLNALAGLADAAGMLADLRCAHLGERAGPQALPIRQLELAIGRASADGAEAVTSEPAIRSALADQVAAEPALPAQVQATDLAVASIIARLDANAGAATAPDLAPLRRITRMLADATSAVEPPEASGPDAPAIDPAGLAGWAATGVKPRIESREDALLVLDRVCQWLQRAEPSNPAPLVIRRAQRLMKMDFLQIVRDVAPNGVDQVLNLIGAAAEQE